MEGSRLERAYDTEEFRKQGHQMIDRIADHLLTCKRGEGKVIAYSEPEEEYSFWRDYEMTSPNEFFEDLMERSIHLHHKRFMGHQVAAPALLSTLAGLMSNVLNVGMGIYEMGSAGTAIERVVAEIFCRAIGYDVHRSDGFFTSGGTLANLTALLAARAAFRERGDAVPYILVSEQAHFCIDRAAMTMGMSEDQVVKIKTHVDYTVDIEELEKAIGVVHSLGGHVMAIVACACSTSTGSYDDLMSISDICTTHQIWMHVDGAHGGAAVFSEKYRSLCKGIDRADSVIIDAHKMMLTPALATAVLFKDQLDSYKSLSTEAAYLFEHQGGEWYNLTKRTYETTKSMMCIKIFVLMQHYGIELIDEYVTRQYDLTKDFASIVKASEDFELGHEPMSNILCFRYVKTGEDLNVLNASIRRRLLEVGRFYLVQTVLDSGVYLRVTIMNPFTTIEELAALLDEIATFAEKP